jgi:SNF2 family DNA or RNA helicase
MRPSFPRFRYRWIGTGTPSPNGLEDLFGQTYILDGGAALGKYITHFRNKWFYTEPWNPYAWIPFENAFNDITNAIAPLVLVMEAKDYLEMPELNVVDRLLKLPPRIQKMYKEVEEDFIANIPDTERELVAPSAAAAGAKCRQICNGAVYMDDGQTIRTFEELHDEKLDYLGELLEEIGEHPTLIVYEFHHDAIRILDRYEDWTCLTGMSGEQLANTVDEFNAGRIPRLLIQSSQAHGLNIQAECHHMVWFGMTWNWEDYKQMVDRLYRQGQRSKMVMVYRLLAEGTLDVEMANRLELKRRKETNVKHAAKRERERRFTDRHSNGVS